MKNPNEHQPDLTLVPNVVDHRRVEVWWEQQSEQRERITRFLGHHPGIQAEGAEVVSLTGVELQKHIPAKRSFFQILTGTPVEDTSDYHTPSGVAVDKVQGAPQQDAVMLYSTNVRTKAAKLFPRHDSHFLSETEALIDGARIPDDLQAVYKYDAAERSFNRAVIEWIDISLYPALLEGMNTGNFSKVSNAIPSFPLGERIALTSAYTDFLKSPAFLTAKGNSTLELCAILKFVNQNFLMDAKTVVFKEPSLENPANDTLTVDQIIQKVRYPYADGGIDVRYTERFFPKMAAIESAYIPLLEGVHMNMPQLMRRVKHTKMHQELNNNIPLSVRVHDKHHVQYSQTDTDIARGLHHRILAEELRHGIDAHRLEWNGIQKNDSPLDTRLLNPTGTLQTETFADATMLHTLTSLEISGQMTAAAVDPILLNEWLDMVGNTKVNRSESHWYAARIIVLLMAKKRGLYAGAMDLQTVASLPYEQLSNVLFTLIQSSPEEFRLLLKDVYQDEFIHPIDEMPFPEITATGNSVPRIEWYDPVHSESTTEMTVDNDVTFIDPFAHSLQGE